MKQVSLTNLISDSQSMLTEEFAASSTSLSWTEGTEWVPKKKGPVVALFLFLVLLVFIE